jgi:hypothetical protein
MSTTRDPRASLTKLDFSQAQDYRRPVMQCLAMPSCTAINFNTLRHRLQLTSKLSCEEIPPPGAGLTT